MLWSTEPANSSAVRNRAWNRGRQLDAWAAKYGLGNRQGLIDHATVKLSSPA